MIFWNSPYLVLNIDVIGRSTPGELYCLSSEPPLKKSKFHILFLILNRFKALSDGELLL